MKSGWAKTIAGVGLIILGLAAARSADGFGSGYGAAATGGTTACLVTNLNDSGSGSLRALE